MKLVLHYGLALGLFMYIGASSVQAQTVIAHEADYAFDGVNSLVDVYDTYSSPAAVTFSPMVTIAGDSSTFTWDGSGALMVSNITTTASTGSATLALTGTGSALKPLIGYSHYEYGSSAGQGLFTTTSIGGNTLLSLTSYPNNYASPFTPDTINVAFLGNWTTNGTGPLQIDAKSFQLGPGFSVTRNFIYDPTFDETFFSAASPVPEPGSIALLCGMMIPAAAFVLRRRARA